MLEEEIDHSKEENEGKKIKEKRKRKKTKHIKENAVFHFLLLFFAFDWGSLCF